MDTVAGILFPGFPLGIPATVSVQCSPDAGIPKAFYSVGAQGH